MNRPWSFLLGAAVGVAVIAAAMLVLALLVDADLIPPAVVSAVVAGLVGTAALVGLRRS